MTDEYINWKASQAKPWAERVMSDSRKVQALQMSVEELRSRYDGLGAVRYDAQPGGSFQKHGDDRMAALVVQLDDAIRDYVAKLATYVGEMQTFAECCMKTEGAHSLLLTMRYCRCEHWTDIAKKLCYSEVYVRGKLHTAALADLYDHMPATERDPFPTWLNNDLAR